MTTTLPASGRRGELQEPLGQSVESHCLGHHRTRIETAALHGCDRLGKIIPSVVHGEADVEFLVQSPPRQKRVRCRQIPTTVTHPSTAAELHGLVDDAGLARALDYEPRRFADRRRGRRFDREIGTERDGQVAFRCSTGSLTTMRPAPERGPDARTARPIGPAPRTVRSSPGIRPPLRSARRATASGSINAWCGPVIASGRANNSSASNTALSANPPARCNPTSWNAEQWSARPRWTKRARAAAGKWPGRHLRSDRPTLRDAATDLLDDTGDLVAEDRARRRDRR